MQLRPKQMSVAASSSFSHHSWAKRDWRKINIYIDTQRAATTTTVNKLKQTLQKTTTTTATTHIHNGYDCWLRPGRSWNCVGSGKWNWKQQLATGKCTPEKYVTNLSRPDNNNSYNKKNRREHTHWRHALPKKSTSPSRQAKGMWMRMRMWSPSYASLSLSLSLGLKYRWNAFSVFIKL